MAQNQTPDSGGVSRRGLLKAGALAAAVAPAASWRRSDPDRLATSGRAEASAPGFAARPAAARRHGHDPADRAHRRGDDGKPLLRQPPWHAAPPRRGRLPARPGRAAPRVESVPRRPDPARLPHADHVPAVRPSGAGLAGQPRPVRRRPTGRLRRLRQRPGLHGLLGTGRPAVLLFARLEVPDRGQVFLLGARANLPEPALPDGGHVDRPGRRHDFRRSPTIRREAPSSTGSMRTASPGRTTTQTWPLPSSSPSST